MRRPRESTPRVARTRSTTARPIASDATAPRFAAGAQRRIGRSGAPSAAARYGSLVRPSEHSRHEHSDPPPVVSIGLAQPRFQEPLLRESAAAHDRHGHDRRDRRDRIGESERATDDAEEASRIGGVAAQGAPPPPQEPAALSGGQPAAPER